MTATPDPQEKQDVNPAENSSAPSAGPRQVVGVVGAGVIGSGVAQTFAQAGHPVILVDAAKEALDRARAEIDANLRLQRLVRPDATFAPGGAAGRRAVLDRIVFTEDLAALADAEAVVENVTEDWEIKRPLYGELTRICRHDAVLAVNTSVIPITRVASVTGNPERVLGMHFMNPVPLKPMVEVIRGHHTSAETIEYGVRLLSGAGKEAVVVADAAGFVSNRVLMLTVNEAAFLVHEGVAAAEDVDRLFKGCFGHPMGPLETIDLIGVDTIVRSLEGLCAEFGDPKYRPCPLLRRMWDAGLLGRKSGRGFYTYS
ncbi:3-hydroxyacyl-CoA dehydrogenase family protein [Streptomyces sp. HPF1205]|uniref:3-hydroxyacyl-CoA dehydrogenase family protein n=1 Tax=Streptomyces sp. HPF1205 TaxID=2873262 RepID=UPI001CED3DC0|nr:3-hydroxyacyl-CoA dehydrogenase NAD-binding domain-containing protein [Streptomyces sp. HPF1205]